MGGDAALNRVAAAVVGLNSGEGGDEGVGAGGVATTDIAGEVEHFFSGEGGGDDGRVCRDHAGIGAHFNLLRDVADLEIGINANGLTRVELDAGGGKGAEADNAYPDRIGAGLDVLEFVVAFGVRFRLALGVLSRVDQLDGSTGD